MEVTNRMGWNRVIAGLAIVMVAILGFAWIDGGHEPVQTISQPIPVPAELK